MKTIQRVLAPLALLAPFGLAGGRGAERLAFTPGAGTKLTKNFEMRGELDLEDSTFEIDGVDQSDLFELEVAMRVSQSLSVTDQYESVAGGRVTRLKRTFDALAGTTRISGSHPVAGPIEEEVKLASELEGATVVFGWNAGQSRYEATFDEGTEGEEELLEGLQEDLDLAGFLPEKEVAEGDSWSIPAAAVRALLAPGGDLKLIAPEAASQMGGPGQVSQNDLIGELDGTFEATFAGIRDEDGARVAVIKLDLEARSARDLTAMVDQLRDPMKLPKGVEAEITSLDGEYELDAEGELLWNMQLGLVHALHLSGQMRQIVDTAMTMRKGAEATKMESSQTFAGTQTFNLTTSL